MYSTPSASNRPQQSLALPPQTPLEYTPGKTELDSPSFDLLRKKFQDNLKKDISIQSKVFVLFIISFLTWNLQGII